MKNNRPTHRLKIALQKKGRLNRDCLNLLTQCGLKLRMKENSLVSHCENLPIDLLFVRDDDIPTLVSGKICDLGIVGENVLREQTAISTQKPIQKLGFARCRLSIAVPLEFPYQNLKCLENKRIATSYPNLLKQFLSTQNVCSDIIPINGSVEIAPRLSMADAICDLVSSGSTLEENYLKEVETVFQSEAVLIQSSTPPEKDKQATLDLLLRRIQAVIKAQDSKYIMFHLPESALPDIKNYLPGFESPTIMPLEGIKNKLAVHLVSREGVFWDTLEKLKALGASSILVMPIEKMLD